MINNLINIKNRYFYISFILLYIIIVSYILKIGPKLSIDSHTYIQLAFDLFNNFDDINFRASLSNEVKYYHYIFTIFIFGLLKVLSPNNWELYYLTINIISIGFIIYTFYLYSNKYKINLIFTIFSLCLFLLNGGLLWSNFIQIDTLYAALIIMLLLIEGCDYYSNNRKNTIITFILILLIFTRPTAIAIISSFILFKISKIFANDKRIHYYNIFIVLLFANLLLFILSNKSSIIFGINELNYISFFFKEGVIIHDRPQYNVIIESNYLSFLKIFIIRFLAFFKLYLIEWSLFHNIANFLFITLYLNSILIFLVIKNNRSTIEKNILYLVFVTAVFHSLIFIDYDFRYRYAITAPMCLFILLNISKVYKAIGFKINTK